MKSAKTIGSLLKLIWRDKKLRIRFVLSLFLMIGLSLAEGVQLALFSYLISIVTRVNTSEKVLSETRVNTIGGIDLGIGELSVGYLGMVICTSLVALVVLLINAKLTEEMSTDISLEVFKRQLGLEYEEASKLSPGESVHLIYHQVNAFTSAYENVLNLVLNGLVALSLTAVLCGQEGWRSVVVIGLLVGAYGLLNKRQNKKLRRLGKEANLLGKRLIDIITTSTKESKNIRIYNAQNYVLKKFNEENSALKVARRKTTIVAGLGKPVSQMVVYIGVFILPAYIISTGKGVEGVGSMIVLAIGLQRILPALQGMGTCLLQIGSKTDSIQAIEDVLPYRGHQRENKVNRTLFNGLANTNETIAVMKSVDFSYNRSKETIIKDVSLKLKRGQVWKINGRSGAGKSTIVDLLTGLLKPSGGSITIQDGIVIAYVQQDTALTRGTIRENILYGREDCSIDNDIWKLLELCCAKDWVLSLENGLDSSVGEYGGSVSGGQRQRLSIARGLLSKPDLLIMDEATSGLDAATERTIIRNVVRTMKNGVLVVISHTDAYDSYVTEKLKL